jgi:hypothetical protein
MNPRRDEGLTAGRNQMVSRAIQLHQLGGLRAADFSMMAGVADRGSPRTFRLIWLSKQF